MPYAIRKALYFLLLVICVKIFFGETVYAQKKKKLTQTVIAENLLQSGPMLGYSEMREVLLWVQTTKEAEVYINYTEVRTEKDTSGIVIYLPKKEATTLEDIFSSQKVKTTAENAFIAKIILKDLQPGKSYEYFVIIDGIKVNLPYKSVFHTQPLWQWRTDAPDFTFAMGSCLYVNDSVYDRPGKPYGGNYKILTSIYEKKPDMMLWLGDNTYLREADWGSASGILYRYTHSRSLKQMQPLLATAHNYAIWDDHDYGPNDSDRSFRGKKLTKQAFDMFWCNPTSGNHNNEGNYTSFEWNDVQFFLLDDRYFRSPNNRTTGDRTMLGKEQLQWLIDGLVSSNATFKIVAMGGQILNPAQVKENYSNYSQERDSLLSIIRKENIKGLLFLSGDRHFTELTKMDRSGTYPLYDFTISPLTSGVHKSAEKEANTMRVEGTLVQQQNFAVGKLSGKGQERTLTVTVYDIDGKMLWERSIAAKNLK